MGVDGTRMSPTVGPRYSSFRISTADLAADLAKRETVASLLAFFE